MKGGECYRKNGAKEPEALTVKGCVSIHKTGHETRMRTRLLQLLVLLLVVAMLLPASVGAEATLSTGSEVWREPVRRLRNNADLLGRLQADDSPRLNLAAKRHISSQFSSHAASVTYKVFLRGCFRNRPAFLTNFLKFLLGEHKAVRKRQNSRL